jgi:hypothetical protein
MERMNHTAPAVHVADFGSTVYFTATAPDVEAARVAVIRAAHDLVFATVGKSAEVTIGLTGHFGGAFVTGAVATVRFL